MSKIAILIPAFNSEKTIGETLASIQRQDGDLNAVEAVYLADDCSTHSTIRTAKSVWKWGVPFKVIESKSNSGERANVNRAVKMMDPDVDWFFLLHSDDIAKPNWLNLQVARTQDCPDSVASLCSSWDTLFHDGRIEPGEDNPSRDIEIIPGGKDSVRGTLSRGCWWHISGCAIRKKAFEDIGEFDPGLPQMGDLDWLLRCLSKSWSIEYIPRTLIIYRAHDSSVSSASFRSDRDIVEGLKILNRYSWALGKWEILAFHKRRIVYALKRALRGFFRLDLRRVWISCKTIGVVVQSMIFSGKQSEQRASSKPRI